MLIIFDLDGTLLNTITDLGIACNYTLEKVGLPTHDLKEYPHLVGNGVNRLIWRALPEDRRSDEYVASLRNIFVEYYDTHNTCHTCPYEGINALLKELKQQGHRLAVASNKYDAAAKKIVGFYFANVFDVVMGEREGVERKPSREIVDNIRKELSWTSKTLYVGDSLVDIATARNAELPVVACSWGFCSREEIEGAKPDMIADSASEILTYVKKIEQ